MCHTLIKDHKVNIFVLDVVSKWHMARPHAYH